MTPVWVVEFRFPEMHIPWRRSTMIYSGAHRLHKVVRHLLRTARHTYPLDAAWHHYRLRNTQTGECIALPRLFRLLRLR